MSAPRNLTLREFAAWVAMAACIARLDGLDLDGDEAEDAIAAASRALDDAHAAMRRWADQRDEDTAARRIAMARYESNALTKGDVL